MESIIHKAYGDPADVLTLGEIAQSAKYPPPSLLNRLATARAKPSSRWPEHEHLQPMNACNR